MAALPKNVSGLDELQPNLASVLISLADTANSSSPGAVFEVCVDAAMALCRWRLVQVVVRQSAPVGTFSPPTAWKLRNTGDCAWYKEVRGIARTMRADGLLTRVVHSRRPLKWDRLNPMVGETWLNAVVDAGFKSAAAFPVLSGSDVVAVLEMYDDTAAAIPFERSEVLRSMAVQAGRSVERNT